MKIVLCGYSGSGKIIPASSYFYKKYFDAEYELIFLNYGDCSQIKICKGQILSLADIQVYGKYAWSTYILEYLKNISDEYVLFGLDDYLLSDSVNLREFEKVFRDFKASDCEMLRLDQLLEKDLENYSAEFMYKKHGYFVTTQLSIWRTASLIRILSCIRTPWEFEDFGSRLFCHFKFRSLAHKKFYFKYPCNSSMSGRHPEKISVAGNSRFDIEGLIGDEILIRNDLTLGMSTGSVPSYDLLNMEDCGFDDYYTEPEIDYYKKLIKDSRQGGSEYIKFEYFSSTKYAKKILNHRVFYLVAIKTLKFTILRMALKFKAYYGK